MRLILFTLVLLTTSGCALLSKGYSADELSYDSDAGGAKLIASLKADNPVKPGQVEDKCLNPNPSSGEESLCQQQRNVAVAALLIQSDMMCQEHIRKIYGNEALLNIGMGTITNLSTGLATVLAATSTKSALSAVAFFSSAEQSLANENVYKEMMTPSVVKKIREAREAKASEFSGHFRETVAQYSVYQALLDVQSYHHTCAFMYGLRKALEEGEKPALDTQIKKLEARVSDITKQLDERKKQLNANGFTTEAVAVDSTVVLYTEAMDAAKKKLAFLITDGGR